tara:strand:+ start:158 stop:373 length:216 start_codon:yes stop_codon:yes gene_type:complete
VDISTTLSFRFLPSLARSISTPALTSTSRGWSLLCLLFEEMEQRLRDRIAFENERVATESDDLDVTVDDSS